MNLLSFYLSFEVKVKGHFFTYRFLIVSALFGEKTNLPLLTTNIHMYFTGGSDGKESACSAGNLGLIPGSRRFPREGNGYLLQYSCLENPMDREAWLAIVHGWQKRQTHLRE